MAFSHFIYIKIYKIQINNIKLKKMSLFIFPKPLLIEAMVL